MKFKFFNNKVTRKEVASMKTENVYDSKQTKSLSYFWKPKSSLCQLRSIYLF